MNFWVFQDWVYPEWPVLQRNIREQFWPAYINHHGHFEPMLGFLDCQFSFTTQCLFFIIRNSSFSFWFQTRTRALVDKMAFAQLGRSLSDKNCGQAIVDNLKIRIQVFMYFTKSVIEKMVSCRYLGHTSLNHNMAEAHSKLTGGWTWRQVWRWKHKRTPPGWRLTPPPPASSCRCDGTSPNSRSIDTIQFRNQVN